MHKHSGRRVTAMLVSLLMLVSAALPCMAQGDGTADKKDADRPSLSQKDPSFYSYLETLKNKPYAKNTITLQAADAALSAENAAKRDACFGKSHVCELSETGYAEWTFTVEEPAVYALQLTYCATTENLRTPIASFMLDGKRPYESAAVLDLPKLWTDTTEDIYDKVNNQLPYETKELMQWQTVLLTDSSSYGYENIRVYLSAGRHTIRFASERDSFAIEKLELTGLSKPIPYSQLKASYDKAGYKAVGGNPLVFQAERLALKSSMEINAVSDRTDPKLQPYDVSRIRYNVLGGSNWTQNGQWVEYRFDVKESGLYPISFKYKQSLQEGVTVCRNVYVDGAIPAEEFSGVAFPYSLKWRNLTVTDNEGTPCYVYLEAGSHTLRLECTTGMWGDLMQQVGQQYTNLTSMYRKIIMVTSSSPDSLRDYHLEKQISGLVDDCQAYAAALFDQADQFDQVNGGRSSQSETLRRMADQLQSFAKKPSTIPSRLGEFRDNIGAISVFLQSMSTLPLTLDYYMIGGEESSFPRARANFWEKFANFFQTFFASFHSDYNSVGGDDGHDAIEVWINSGRDYANILKKMINSYFTPQTDIGVNLSMVQGSIIEATLAGSGPEVCVEMPRGYPVNLASRGALLDVSELDGFDQVAGRYLKDAMVPYTYNNGIYGVPLSQSFFMMFYREDILNELQIPVPQTWTEFMDAAKLLQRKNMSVCLPYTSVSVQGSAEGGIGAKDIFSSLLMQMGGSFYNEDLSASALDSREAYKAFQMWTDFYAKYNYPLTVDFASRFRSGDVPLGVLSYNMYCTLTDIAPEIRGLWKMTPIPGIQKEDGTIDRTVGTTGSAVCLFKKAKQKNHVDACWKFIQWFTQDDMQYQYASRIEAMQGVAGRYTAANVHTFSRLPWSRDELAALKAQQQWIQEVNEVPGCYYVSRCLDNAFRGVVYRSDNVRDALRKQNKYINEELKRKHDELSKR